MFKNIDEVDYEITKKGTPERDSVISQKSLAILIVDIIHHPEKYKNENLGLSKNGN